MGKSFSETCNLSKLIYLFTAINGKEKEFFGPSVRQYLVIYLKKKLSKTKEPPLRIADYQPGI
jgi:hypothetical protein